MSRNNRCSFGNARNVPCRLRRALFPGTPLMTYTRKHLGLANPVEPGRDGNRRSRTVGANRWNVLSDSLCAGTFWRALSVDFLINPSPRSALAAALNLADRRRIVHL